MTVDRIINSLFASCTYLIDDGAGGIWLVDCGDVEPIVEKLMGRTIRGVLLTHGHFDHIYGLNDLCRRFPELIVYTNEYGRECLLNDRKNMSHYHETQFVFERADSIRIVTDAEEIPLSKDLKATVVATPGHNPSCLTYIIGNAIFTGDAYIPGLKVVTNLPKADKTAAAQSVSLIKTLARHLTIHPGHPAQTTIQADLK